MKSGLPLLTLLIGGMACSGGSSTDYLPPSSGEYGHVYAVVESDLLSDKLKTSIRDVFEEIQPLYGGPEPYFEVDFLTPDLFKGPLRQDGTMIFIGSTSRESELRTLLPDHADSIFNTFEGKNRATFVIRDVWAGPQRVLFILTSNKDSLSDFLNGNKEALLQKLLDLEKEEAATKLTHHIEKKIQEQLLKEHYLDIKVPSQYHIARNERSGNHEGFIWLRKETDKTDLGILIHYEPYTDTVQFNLPYIIARRDTIGRKWMPGQTEGSYLGTDTQFPYEIRSREFKGRFAREYYGYWDMIKGFDGGPYYSLTIHDKERNRLVTIEGLVWAPNREKTKYVRELQGLIQKIDF